jgi:predicted porin
MKTFLTFALVAGAATAASAQGSVTLSGIADAAARYVKNEGRGSMKSMVSGSNSTSRIVIRGTEDLGGGLVAGFHLEHGLLLDTGQTASTSQFWDRRSTLSLGSKTFGELRAGRDFVPSYVNWSRYDPFSYVGVAGSNNLISATPSGPIRNAFGSNPNTTVRSSNALQWLLPSGWGGLEGAVMVAAGEGGTAASGQHKVVGARLGWSGGGFGVSAATTTTENNLTGGDRFRDHAIGGHGTIGTVRLSAAWRQFRQADARQTQTLVGAVLPVGAVGEVKASWVRANLAGRVGATSVDSNDAQQFGLGYVHNLSKRTALYATVSRLSNDGGATFVVPGGPGGIAGGSTSSGYEAGIRHSF